MADPADIVPRVVVQSHLDGDARPRTDEIAKWCEVMRRFELDKLLCLILTEGSGSANFPGYTEHWWELSIGAGGLPVVTPAEVHIEITPD